MTKKKKKKGAIKPNFSFYLNAFHYENEDCDLSLWPANSLLNSNLFFTFTLLFIWFSN